MRNRLGTIVRAMCAACTLGLLASSAMVTEAGCSSDRCGCDDVSQGAVIRPLDCLCNGSTKAADAGHLDGCPRTTTELESNWCANLPPLFPLLRKTGCGNVVYALGGGLGGTEATFDASGKLVGVFHYSDTGYGDCSASGYVYGTRGTCANAETCLLCGTGSEPPCQ